MGRNVGLSSHFGEIYLVKKCKKDLENVVVFGDFEKEIKSKRK